METHSFISLRKGVLEKYPDLKLNEKHPAQIGWFFLLMALILLFSNWIIHASQSGRTLAMVMTSIILGLVYASLGLFTHELLHGSIIENKRVTQIFAFFGFFILGLAPEVWLTWHNRVHHYHTNHPSKDPDSFGLWEGFQKYPMYEFLLKKAPGAKYFWSWLYLPLNFTNQAATVTWYFLWKGDPKLYSSAKKNLVLFESFLIVALWVACFFAFGAKTGIFMLVIPSLIANLVTTSYILIQHLMCPLTDENHPLENTLGVTTLPWIDQIHFNFSHHIEHHVFPELNHSEYPKVREILMREYPKHYRLVPHSHAIYKLLTTPRVYQNHSTLWDPKTGDTFEVSNFGRK